MLDSLRIPFFILALLALILLIGVEIGAAWLNQFSTGTNNALALAAASNDEIREALEESDSDQFNNLDKSGDRPPGLGIAYLALVDGVLLFTSLHMGSSLIISKNLHARFQGCVSCLYAFFLLLSTIGMTLVALATVILMVSLLIAMPFGTIVYLARYGYFDRGAASMLLSLTMLLTLVYAVCMLLAQQRFLQNKGWLILLLSSIILKIVLSFLHGLVPIILVSITDGIGAIITGICAIIWAIILLIGAVPAILRVIRFDR